MLGKDTPSWIPGFRTATFVLLLHSLEALYHPLRVCGTRRGLGKKREDAVASFQPSVALALPWYRCVDQALTSLLFSLQTELIPYSEFAGSWPSKL